jgi:hypothetical protein
MMPPPITSMRLGIDFNCSAPVESTMRGSSGTKGRFADCDPAAMIAFWKRRIFLAPVFACPAPSVTSTTR